MIKGLSLTALICMAALLVGCNTAPSKPFTINGEYIAVGSTATETDEDADAIAPESTDNSSEATTEEFDLSTATIVVVQETVDPNGEMETVELASGGFVDGKVTITGEIREPTEVKITVAGSDDNNLSTSALLIPDGENVSFVLMDYETQYPSDGLILAGASRRSQDSATRFTVSGDLSGGKELSHGSVTVSGQIYKDGKLEMVTYGSVALRDNSFTIEADIQEPEVVRISVVSNDPDPNLSFFSSMMAVAEPQSAVNLTWLDSSENIVARSANERHVNVVESWQLSDEYREAQMAYDKAYAAYLEEWRAANETQEAASVDTEDSTASDDSMADATETEELQSEAISDEQEADPPKPEGLTEEQLAAYPDHAKGCEHVVIDQEIRTLTDMMVVTEDDPEWRKLSEQMSAIQSKALQNIANNAEDPVDALLAMEAGAYSPYSEERSEAIEAYGKLEKLLDEDLVARRLAPARDRLILAIEVEENDMSLVQGQKAPAFALADLAGEEVSLESILQEQELVLVDFWASWCGPCIATFPELKRMHAAYNDDGFEIVAISIDSTMEAWETASEEHEIPWINLGEIKGWEGPTASAYGVQFIPKGYLLDSEGCVIKKDLHTDKLNDLLVARYGEAPLPADSEADSEAEEADSATDEMGG
ncbi:MAG: TlpA disulfide reductase family protein [Gammaproteobacteria bacterium]|nr:TlpA disulfide reductase family protein [Gammaproteobacteria bacterium]